MDVPRGNYAKWNKEDKEKDKNHDLTYMWNLKENKTELIDTENRLVLPVRGWEVWEKVKGVKRYRLPSYNMSKSLGCNAEHGDYNQ